MKRSREKRTELEQGKNEDAHTNAERIPISGDIAKMGCSGLFFDANLAVFPPTVKLAMHLAFTFLATCLAASMIADAELPSVILGLLLWRYIE